MADLTNEDYLSTILKRYFHFLKLVALYEKGGSESKNSKSKEIRALNFCNNVVNLGVNVLTK